MGPEIVKAKGTARARPVLWGPILLFQTSRHSVGIYTRQAEQRVLGSLQLRGTDRQPETEMHRRKQWRLNQGTRPVCGDRKEWGREGERWLHCESSIKAGPWKSTICHQKKLLRLVISSICKTVSDSLKQQDQERQWLKHKVTQAVKKDPPG